MKRRSFIRKTGLGILGSSILTGLYTWQIEPFWVEFVKRKMQLENLPSKLLGKTVMQISDIHVGNRFDYNYLIESFKKAQLRYPDIVVYTGDYVSYEDETQFKQLAEVLKSAVKGKLGTYAILGNHDYGKDWKEPKVATTITNLLEIHGIKVLRNEADEIDGLKIIGFDDYWGTNFDPDKALSYYDISKPTIALCHNPDVCDLPIWEHFKGWILSGHTHGGQCKPPFLPPPMLPVKNKKYNAGEISLGWDKTLYINRALGHLWQVRFNVRPEITIFELENVV